MNYNMDNFDPQKEFDILMEAQRQNNNMSHLDRKTIWQQSKRMKQENEKKQMSENIISQLVPKIEEIAIGNLANMKI